MALEVEVGFGSATAESYISVEDAQVYWDAHGYDYEALDDSEDETIEKALRRAVSAIDAKCRGRLSGAYPVTTTQRLLFPVVGLVDPWGRSVASNAVPVEVIDAQAEAGWRELVTPGSMAPDVAAGGLVIKREKVGPLETEYERTNAAQSTSFAAIDNILAGLFGASGGVYSGRTVRA